MTYPGSSEKRKFFARLTTGANSAPIQGGGQFVRRFGTDGRRVDRLTRGYVPKSRNIDEIQKEDDLAKELYSMVFETDENILVTGAGNKIAVIDSWNQIGLDSNIMQNINRSGYVHPRKIQAYAIPLIIDGYDLKAQAETGSGKSAAFLIPLINKIIGDKKRNPISGGKNKPFAIIMEPTRELALQLYDQARKIAFNTGVRVVKAYGQYDVADNKKEIMGGSDIVIGTPGRLSQFIGYGTIDVAMLKYLVLDEADRLISDFNFLGIIQKIRGLSTYPKEENVQNLLFSATFPEKVEILANDLLKSKRAFVHNELTIAVNSKITQEFIACPQHEKKIKVLEFLKSDLKQAQAINANAKQPRTLIFVRKRSDADLVCLFLCDSGIRATTINGDRPQKERELALEYFRSNETPVLVATDVCARGLDIKDLDWVINMDLPDTVETYVHRIGRTGRLKAGRALSFFDRSTDHSLASSLVKLLEESNSPNIPAFLRDPKSSQAPANGFGSQQQSGGSSGFGAQQKSGSFGTKTSGFGNWSSFGSAR
ncbi:hypothetical protein M3Y97_00635600 [Aphelenchoides bicaudatus]|nr:hypothetical protein M3Y97_00635600 [Aphelenchoides bicaudatus]